MRRMSRPPPALWWLLAFSAATVVLWHSPVLFPLRAFVVLIHEAGHALATLATGGEVEELVVRPNESGHVLSRGGWSLVIYSAGYVGTALLGSMLLALTRRPAAHRIAVAVLGVVLVVITVLYVPFANAFGFALGLAWGAALLVMAIKRFKYLARVVDALAVMLCLYAVYDFADFLIHDTGRTDAGLLAKHLGVPFLAYPIGLGWTAMSLYLMYRGLRIALAADRAPAKA